MGLLTVGVGVFLILPLSHGTLFFLLGSFTLPCYQGFMPCLAVLHCSVDITGRPDVSEDKQEKWVWGRGEVGTEDGRSGEREN